MAQKSNKIEVLDKGYVILRDSMGDDHSVSNAARASYAKETESFEEKDVKLIRFLIREGHHSVLRHQYMSFEVKAPLMVAAQWRKYVIGSAHTVDDGWNEASRRYITMEPEFYIPNADGWRSKPENSKQGSGPALPTDCGYQYTAILKAKVTEGLVAYEMALHDGIAPEQARLLLPAYAMYTNWWWTCSLASCRHFLDERVANDAQWEIQQYALAVLALAKPLFENVVEAWNDRG